MPKPTPARVRWLGAFQKVCAQLDKVRQCLIGKQQNLHPPKMKKKGVFRRVTGKTPGPFDRWEKIPSHDTVQYYQNKTLVIPTLPDC